MATDPLTPQAPQAPKKRRSFSFDQDEVVHEVLAWYDQDIRDRQDWSDRRLQRYAKYRGWLEQKHYPWPDASNAFVPLMLMDSQQMQDTLHNGILSQRPVMTPQAITPADKDKADQIAELLDYQIFVEQKGEKKFGHLIESFVNDGTMYSFQAWVKDEVDGEQVHMFKALQPGPVTIQLRLLIEGLFKDVQGAFIDLASEDDPFTWSVKWVDEHQKPHTAKVEFYTHDDGRLLCIVKRTITLFDGPFFRPLSEEDIVFPSRCENLQPPSSSNPSGAHHVFLVDYPSLDEIKRLRQAGYYDLLTEEQLETLEGVSATHRSSLGTGDDPDQHKIQKDTFAGQTTNNSEAVAKTFTRLMCFARWDVDGDGLDENVVFWFLREPRLLVRARLMQEMFPSEHGTRPLVHEQFIPIPGQIRGLGLLEMLEHLQDMMKILIDQLVDKNTLVNTPWFFFRPTSGIRPEVIRMAPGEGYPVANPQQDVAFPQLPTQGMEMSLNLAAVYQTWADKVAVIGDLQFGRVPQGKASALRTTTGMMAVLQSGAARPERIIRRFFMGLSDIYQQLHNLNTIYLQPKKQYRVLGAPVPGADPYRMVDDPSKVKGQFTFEFKANSLNTQKAVKAQILQSLGPIMYNPMTVQMGMVTPDNVYRWLKDVVTDAGQDVNQYLTPPSPESAMPKITAEHAVGQLYLGYIPEQAPAEGPQQHLQRLQMLLPQLQREGSVDAAFMVLFNTYVQKVQIKLMEQQMMAQAAQQFAQVMSGGGGSGGSSNREGTGAPQQAGGLQPQGAGQLMDETLPSAGGGGMTGAF